MYLTLTASKFTSLCIVQKKISKRLIYFQQEFFSSVDISILNSDRRSPRGTVELENTVKSKCSKVDAFVLVFGPIC